MIDQPMPFGEAIGFLLKKEQLPAEWDSKTWAAQEGDFRSQAFFSAKVENARFLDRAQTLLFDYMAKVREDVIGPDGKKTTALSVADRSHFVQLMRDFMIAEGMAKPEDFSKVNQKDVTDIRSIARLNLIFDTNVRSAYGFGQWKQGMQPAVLRAFPAARLIRERGVAVPRPRHQANLGEVRLKTDLPWWADFQNARDIGGFGVPWGPYGFNSGANQEDVPRAEAKALGLDVSKVKPADGKLTDGTQASTRKMDPDLKRKLLEELRKGPKPRDPEEVARQAAAETRREMLRRGMGDAERAGDYAKVTKYQQAIAELPQRGLVVREDGDTISLGGAAKPATDTFQPEALPGSADWYAELEEWLRSSGQDSSPDAVDSYAKEIARQRGITL